MNSETVFKVRNLRKWFPLRDSFLSTLFSRSEKYVRAVDDVDFSLKKSHILCLAGESGCGKTTMGKLAVRAIEPTAGEVFFKGTNISAEKGKLKDVRTKIQMIFQDPYSSINPRMSIRDIVAEPLDVNRLGGSQAETTLKIMEALTAVALNPTEHYINRYPHELSGGQRQRVAIARALILTPEIIVADEPTSMLDASVRINILNLLLDLKKNLGLSFLFITHDLAQARYVGDDLAVMYLGKIVESGPIDDVIDKPLHPYTEALISNVPSLDPVMKGKRIMVKGETPSPIDIPSGCRFHPRCPASTSKCSHEEPEFAVTSNDRLIACHLRT